MDVVRGYATYKLNFGKQANISETAQDRGIVEIEDQLVGNRIGYDTHRRTKLTAHETISRSRDMVGAHESLNGSRKLTTPLPGIVYHSWASTPTVNLPVEFEVSFSTHREDMKVDTKCRKWVV